jgi:hypothetical protein
MKQNSQVDQEIFNLMDALRSPVLTHTTSWADCIPKRLLDIITTSRMASLILHEELATYPEVTAFMMTRVMEAPMPSEWVEIYLHCSCQVCEQYWQKSHWEELQAKKVLGEYETKQFLLPLRRWIYERRRKALKEKLKKEKPIEVKAEEINHPILLNIVECQLSLF